MPRGKYITLEGGEGAGKSTQAKRLAAFLKKKGIKTVLTREVGGAPGAEKIRKIWLEEGEGYWDKTAELMLVFAARREHLVKTVWPALKKGCWVVSDRFMDSTRAYQGLPDLTYPFHDNTVHVTLCVRICLHRKKINLSTVFAGQAVGLK